MERVRLLLVDDEDDFRRTVAKTADETGYRHETGGKRGGVFRDP